MNETTELDRAAKAKAVLDSPAYQEAYAAVRQSLIDGIEKCTMSDTVTAEEFRRCLKLLRSVQQNMERALSSGKVAEFRLAEAEKRKANPLRNIFR